jgi:hypothetical protein
MGSRLEIPEDLKAWVRWHDVDGVPYIKKGQRVYSRNLEAQLRFVDRWDEEFGALCETYGRTFVLDVFGKCYRYEDRERRYYTPQRRWSVLIRWVEQDAKRRGIRPEKQEVVREEPKVEPPQGSVPVAAGEHVRVEYGGRSMELWVRHEGGFRDGEKLFEFFKGEPKCIWDGKEPKRKSDQEVWSRGSRANRPAPTPPKSVLRRRFMRIGRSH